ncbi:MAG TPA: nucleoside diphosphate kinase regulator [Thermoleophilia bacterium]|nr:nucleoside diphosphate kinase regulator [Thermoleophilia bacterium]HQG55238.1 nucleoside diphosphate kinase regulator [Thermoleophilia bacterium]
MAERKIFITQSDKERLEALLQKDGEYLPRSKQGLRGLRDLQRELERARVVAPEEIPSDVVTMNSRVLLRDADSGEAITCTLVFPGDADMEKGAVSVLAPVGTAILGYREGDTIEWMVPSGLKRFTIEKVIYQPEADGHFEL